MIRPPPNSPLFPSPPLFRSLAVGDTATAVRTLDAPLDSLVALHTATLRFLPIAGALVRMMALRANLAVARGERSEEHTSELQSRSDLVCRLLLEKKKYDHCT